MAALVDFARLAVDVTEVRDGDVGDHRTPNHAVVGLGRQAFTGQCTACVLVADVALWNVMRTIAKVWTRTLHQFGLNACATQVSMSATLVGMRLSPLVR